MISRCNPLLLTFLITLFLYCNREPGHLLSSAQEEIIRTILRENGFSVGNNENVEKYLRLFNSDGYAPGNDRYWLLLPAPGQTKLVLTDHINSLNSMFHGIDMASGSNVDTVLIISDSIIKIPVIGICCALKNIPVSIRQLRGRSFSFRENQISHVPDEIMELSEPPVFFDTLALDIIYNKIDTAKISYTLYKWLDKYAGTNWVRSQNPD